MNDMDILDRLRERQRKATGTRAQSLWSLLADAQAEIKKLRADNISKWTPLQQAAWVPATEEQITEQMRLNNATRERIVAMFEEQNRTTTVWKNDIYQVARRVLDPVLKVVHLNIRRVDGAPVLRDWRHFQRIKNELLGEECEAVELYPAESRLVDTSNKYHLIGIADPHFRFPFGDIFGNRRDVSYTGGVTPGTRQRPIEEASS